MAAVSSSPEPAKRGFRATQNVNHAFLWAFSESPMSASIAPTAVSTDYTPATEAQKQHNEAQLRTPNGKEFTSKKGYNEEEGVIRTSITMPDMESTIKRAVKDFRERFVEGKFSLHAAKEVSPTILEGGWVGGYHNSLHNVPVAQKRSVFIVPDKPAMKKKFLLTGIGVLKRRGAGITLK